MKATCAKLFGDYKELAKKEMADWFNTAPLDQLKAVLSTNNKVSHVEFYKLFSSKEDYEQWREAYLLPERREARYDCFSEEQRADDKLAFQEVFGSA